MRDTYIRIAYEYLDGDGGLVERERHYFDVHDAPAPYCPYPPGCIERDYATSRVIRETGFRD